MDQQPQEAAVVAALKGYGEAVLPLIVMSDEERHRRKMGAAIRAAFEVVASDPAIVDRGVRALYESWRLNGDETTTPEDVQTCLCACLGIEGEQK